MELNKEFLVKALKDKMGDLALRPAAQEMGISTATLHRILGGSDLEMNNFCKVITWLGKPIQEFFTDPEKRWVVTLTYRTFVNEETATIIVKAKTQREALMAAHATLQDEIKQTATLTSKIAFEF